MIDMPRDMPRLNGVAGLRLIAEQQIARNRERA